MPDTKADIISGATRRAMDLAEKTVERLRKEFAQELGSEEVSAVHVGDLVDKVCDGDDQALLEVVYLADRQTAMPNPVLEIVARKLKEKGY